MRDIIVYALIALLYKVESRTLCDDERCVCWDKESILQISCSSHPDVLKSNYRSPNGVRILDLSQNNLTRIERSPSLASKTLKQLLLDHNRINEIATDAFNLPSLEILDLSHNLLERIPPDAFSSLQALEYLNLANNQFSVFGNLNFYNLQKLRSIILDNNDIGPSFESHSLFEGGYGLTSKVQSISVNNVNLNCKNKFIFSSDNLKNLSVAHNNITELFVLGQGLEYLDLSYNPIKEITGDLLFDPRYLIELKLNNILIEEVPDMAFVYLTSLRYLELDGNTRLKRFSSLGFGRRILMEQDGLLLKYLTLRGASLSSLDPQMAGIFKEIKRVDLQDNPWYCDCQLAWLQNIKIPKDLGDLRCASPPHLINRKVLELNSTEFVCVEKTAPSSDYVRTSINVAVYCSLLVITVLMMYFFIFSPKPFMYRELPVEFPRTP